MRMNDTQAIVHIFIQTVENIDGLYLDTYMESCFIFTSSSLWLMISDTVLSVFLIGFTHKSWQLSRLTRYSVSPLQKKCTLTKSSWLFSLIHMRNMDTISHNTRNCTTSEAKKCELNESLKDKVYQWNKKHL